MGYQHQVLFMRHPQTVANTDHFLSGRTDVAVTEEGERQLVRAVEALVAWKPDRIWTSPLVRCKRIAEAAAARLQVPCEIHDAFVEIEFGPLQDAPQKDLPSYGYEFPWALDEAGHSVAPAGAENFEMLIDRAHAALDELRPLAGRTAVVSHGGFGRAFVAAALEIPVRTFWNVEIPNVSSQLFGCDGQRFTLAALALTPEEIRARQAHPELVAADMNSRASYEVT